MEKLKIKIIILGYIPKELDINKLKKWNSDLFEISKVDYLNLNCNSDINNWAYSDKMFKKLLENINDGTDFVLVIANIPLENQYFSRIFSDNKIILTFHEIKKVLFDENIPLENLVFRILYAYSLAYIIFGNKISTDYEKMAAVTHEETKGCVFDMNPFISDVVVSCNRHVICEKCQERLIQETNISMNTIEKIMSELQRVKKTLYYRWLDYIKIRRVRSVIISSSFVILLSVISSILYDFLKTYF